MSGPSKMPAPQSHMASGTGMMLRPNGVREYSVPGGLSGMTSRCSIPILVGKSRLSIHSLFFKIN